MGPRKSAESAVPARASLPPGQLLAWLGPAIGPQAFEVGAEVLQAFDIFIGVNAVDYSGYPDCRPEFIRAFTALAQVATKAGVGGLPMQIHTPLIALTKAEIIAAGLRLGVDYATTASTRSRWTWARWPRS